MGVLSMDGELVVSEAEIRYRVPVTGMIECRTVASEAERKEFQDSFINTGKGKLSLRIEVGDAPHAVLVGTFYAVSRA